MQIKPMCYQTHSSPLHLDCSNKGEVNSVTEISIARKIVLLLMNFLPVVYFVYFMLYILFTS